jgi:hypothetical protein
MSGVVIGLVSLLLLVVIGAIIYFSMQEEKEPAYVAPVVTPVVITPTEKDDDDDDDTFDIVNGWIYDNEYENMIALNSDMSAFNNQKFNEESPVDSAKWTFEPDDEFYQITREGKKYIKIGSPTAGVQLVSSPSSTSRVIIVPTDKGYTFSDKRGKYWLKMVGANLKTVDLETDASVFTIEPSQYYIKGYETEKETFDETDLITSMGKHVVSCADGVLSGFKFVKSGTKVGYEYDCTQGELASGDLSDKVVLESGPLSGAGDLERNSFKVKCGDTGALARFRILQGPTSGVSDKTASYEYTCRDVSTTKDDEKKISQEVDYDANKKQEFLTGIQNLDCGGEGYVLTGFEYTSDGNNPTKKKLSGVCKKLA